MKGQTDPDRWLFVFWDFQNVSWFFEECASWQGALSIYLKNPEISVGTKMDFLTGKKLFPERRRARYPMGHQDGCRVGNNWNWYKVQETCKWNTKFLSENSNRENGPTFLDFPLFREFSSGTNRPIVFHFLSSRNFQKFWLNGKSPRSTRIFRKKISERRKKQWPRLKKQEETERLLSLVNQNRINYLSMDDLFPYRQI